jgi:hypothetical protein
VTLIPATFLAGSLLTLLLPVGLLIALTVWYVMFVRRVPETGDGQEAVGSPPAARAPTEPAAPSD